MLSAKLSAILLSRLMMVLLIVFSLSCQQEEKVFLADMNFSNNTWATMDTLMLTAHINDTSKIYSWNFYVEILPDYPYSNIWLFVSMKSPDGTLNTDTLDFTLADNKGEWYGTHHDEYTLSRNQILPCMKYKSPGEYKLSIVQGMRTDNLKGIRNIELNLIACKKQ